MEAAHLSLPRRRVLAQFLENTDALKELHSCFLYPLAHGQSHAVQPLLQLLCRHPPAVVAQVVGENGEGCAHQY